MNWAAIIFSFFVCLAALFGWRIRTFELITPEYGLGYFLGNLGTACMAALLVYSLRKRMSELAAIGTVKIWFRLHMFLGVLGPIFILFHANFRLGSFNSNVALALMLIVATSGIIGRYIYKKIHHGLYGERATLMELQRDFETEIKDASLHLAFIPALKEELFSFSKDILVRPATLSEGLMRLILMRWRSRGVHARIRTISKAYFLEYADTYDRHPADKARMQRMIGDKTVVFTRQALKVSEFGFFERLFSLWHALHIPFVFVLYFSIIVHVVTVSRF